MTDPNADLIGKSWTDTAGETVTVTGSVEWSEQYVNVRFPTGFETIKPVAVVRRHLELIGGA